MQVREGEIPAVNAAQIGKVLSDPTLLEPGDDWERVAREKSKKEVEEAVQKRIEQRRQKTPRAYALGFHVKRDAKAAYERLRKLLSKKRRRTQTPPAAKRGRGPARASRDPPAAG